MRPSDWIVIFLILFLLYMAFDRDNLERKRAGSEGERIAEKKLRSVMEKGDYLLSNINLSEEGRKTELDKLIINRNGIFIFEVKNYSGTVYGTTDSQYWQKEKISRGGKRYIKFISNPIVQLKREINILATLLRNNNIRVWVNGYVYLISRKCQIKSELVLTDLDRIDRIIHTTSGKELSEEKIKQIIDVLDKHSRKRTLKKVKVYKK